MIIEELSPDDIEKGRLLFAGPCDFVMGVASLHQLPVIDRNEIAFAGRSNVGKSSLVNALTGRSTLARTSNTPGRTQELNYFNLGDVLYLVDMPGYGYAKVSKELKQKWNVLIKDYLRGRPTLRTVFILIDSRHGVKESDEELMKMLDEAAVSYRIVFTKADKTKAADLQSNIQKTLAVLKKHPAAYPSLLLTSSVENTGLAELRAFITALQ